MNTCLQEQMMKNDDNSTNCLFMAMVMVLIPGLYRL